MYTIGEFSKITSFSIKTLRLYHDKGLLVPAQIDEWSNYRYYDAKNYETARTIRILRSFDFTLNEIKTILDECSDDMDMLAFLEKKQAEITAHIRRYENISNQIAQTIQAERDRVMSINNFSVEEKNIPTMLIAAFRMRSTYDQTGIGLQKVAKAAGRYICGKAMNLYYDAEYKETDAEFDTCFPVRKGANGDGISVRELTGGKAISLIHKGAYDTLHESYKTLLDYVKEHNLTVKLPTREIYLKGPGMIFRGNPNNYLTEIIYMLEG